MDEKEPDFRISLGGYTFDPLEERLEIPRDLSDDAMDVPPEHHLVQFTRPLTREDSERLRRYGLRLTDHIPNRAYVERLTPRQLATLAKDPAFRASVPYQPAFKLSPRIGQVPF